MVPKELRLICTLCRDSHYKPIASWEKLQKLREIFFSCVQEGVKSGHHNIKSMCTAAFMHVELYSVSHIMCNTPKAATPIRTSYIHDRRVVRHMSKGNRSIIHWNSLSTTDDNVLRLALSLAMAWCKHLSEPWEVNVACDKVAHGLGTISL